ncbi:hypothetical protein [Moorena producens]|uniref:hypothetical protein n=1 Tax=Moorena producens TaxID=1155739 RepID=UPI003C792A70
MQINTLMAMATAMVVATVMAVAYTEPTLPGLPAPVTVPWPMMTTPTMTTVDFVHRYMCMVELSQKAL